MELSNESCVVIGCSSYEENVCMNDFQSLSLTDDIHKLCDRINKISINESSFIKNLEEWRNEAHEIIDKFCKLKSDEYIRRTKEEIDRLQETVNLLSSDHDAAQDYIDWVKETIEIIHQQLDELQQIQTKFSSLQIENSIICLPSAMCNLKRQPTPLKDLFSFPLSPLSPCSSFANLSFSFESPKQILKLPSDHWYSLAVNETHLLLTDKSNIFLLDRSLTIVNKKSFIKFGIKDICWSKILSRFILISPKEIYLFDEKNFSLEICSINLINNSPWERGTSSETILFLSTFGENPFIVEFNLLPSIHFNKRYQTSIICSESEVINDMKSNQIYLGLIIDNGFSNESRLEIRSIKSFECIWSIDLGKGWGYRCSFLEHDHWIVSDSYNYRLIHITNNGTIEKIDNYSTKPMNVVHWGEDQTVIRTIEGLNIHQYK
jgi:hypothetical protein